MRSVEERLRSRITVSEYGCWNWTGSTDGRYGQIFYCRRLWKSHRVSWTVFRGPIPEGLNVLHRCDNTRCINPDHLFLGTQSDNLIDCAGKGRSGAKTRPDRLARGDANGARKWPERLARGDQNGLRRHPQSVRRGEKSATAKLTDEQAREIRERGMHGERRCDIAKRFGVSERTIHRILKWEAFKHVS